MGQYPAPLQRRALRIERQRLVRLMTNAHHDPPSHSASSDTPQVSSHPGTEYEGFDPDLPEGKENSKFLGLSSVQVGASAMAAVTSALAASFFGVAGTLIGAAVGSIISTVAGAMYAESMRRAKTRLRTAQTVVIQQTPMGSAIRPTQLPRTEALTKVIPAEADQTIVLPASPAQPGGHTAAGASGQDLAETSIINTQDLGATLAGTDGPAPVAAKRLWWRRPVYALPIVGVAGFIIAVAVITGIEGVTGHTFSGGSGTSISKIGGSSSGTKQTPSPSVTNDQTATTEPSSSATPSSEPTQEPTQTPEPSATAQPSESATTAPVTSPPVSQDQIATSSPASTAELNSNSQSAAVPAN